jgi:hypothetical protein
MLATSDPIIVFNISEIRSDIFIVDVDKIRFLSLPYLKITDLESHAKSFLDAVDKSGHVSHRASVNQEIHVVLKWLL